GFPALDAASKDAAKMTIKIDTGHGQEVHPKDGGMVQGGQPLSKQKMWLPSNFRLRIDGLEEPCTRVNKVEAIVVRQGGSTPNLVITLPESHAALFHKWHEEFVLRGAASPK